VRISRDLRVNQEIRAREVRLVDDDGRQLGVVPLREAMRIALERGLDVVEVAPTASPVVCRIMDYGRFKYEQEKREREARRRQHLVEVKELVLKTYNIDPHDLETLARKGERLLRDGHKLKLTMRFRGREIVHADLGRDVFRRLVGMLAGVAQVESEPRQEGRILIMTLAPRPEVQRAAIENARRHAGRVEGAGAVAAEAEGAEQAPAAQGPA
jgi:translation initiation factor IF-3